jgi:16S rRNA A1518/A1519 N6-dimethyltransferase RsmA/KsgA/DIM1 with predicted DNA glycosylase/AP lyase activity
MVPPRRQLLAQHFLWNRQLVDRLVRASSISSRDLVLEIGPGRGILTQVLLQAAARVIAVELDENLCEALRQKLGHHRNLVLVRGDCLALALPREPYKVFANIPFNITGDIVRKLLQSDDPPSDCYLLMQTEAAGKFLPNDRHNSLAALLYYPWWEMRVTHHFQRADFIPRPRVDTLLLQIARRSAPLLGVRQKALYQNYLADCFGRDPHAGRRAPDRFLSAFRSFSQDAGRGRLWAMRGAFARLQGQQQRLTKIHRTRTDRNWRKR